MPAGAWVGSVLQVQTLRILTTQVAFSGFKACYFLELRPDFPGQLDRVTQKLNAAPAREYNLHFYTATLFICKELQIRYYVFGKLLTISLNQLGHELLIAL